MNKLILLYIFLFLAYPTNGQIISKISTSHIDKVLKEKGIYEALEIVNGMPISLIDSLVTLNLLNECTLYGENYQQTYFLNFSAKQFKNRRINEILLNHLKLYRQLYLKAPENISIINRELFAGLIFQKDTSSISNLINEFAFWEKEETRLKLEPESSKGKHMISVSHLTSLYLVQAIKEINTSNYSIPKLDKFISTYPEEAQEKFYFNSNFLNMVTKWDTIKLNSSCNSLGDLYLRDEKDLINQVSKYGEIDNRWSIDMFYNDLNGVLNLYYIIAPSGGWDFTFQLKLIGPNTIAVRFLEGGTM